MGHYGGSYKVTYDLHKKYGDFRLLDTPICGKQIYSILNTAYRSVLPPVNNGLGIRKVVT